MARSPAPQRVPETVAAGAPQPPARPAKSAGRRASAAGDDAPKSTSQTFRVESITSLIEVEARRCEDTPEQNFSSTLRLEVRCVVDGIRLRKAVEIAAGEITHFGTLLRKIGLRTASAAHLGRGDRMADEASIDLWRSSDSQQLFVDVRVASRHAQYTVTLRGLPLAAIDLDRLILWCVDAAALVAQPATTTSAVATPATRRQRR